MYKFGLIFKYKTMAKYIELESIANYLNEDELNNLLSENKDNPYFEKMVDFTPIKSKTETLKQDDKTKERLKILKSQVSYNPIPETKEVITESYESSKDPKLKKFLSELDQAGITNADDRDYLVKLAEKESSLNANAINTFGYKGYYQFDKPTLRNLGFTTKDLDNPLTQHIAALKLRDMNLIGVRKYIGKEINGITLNKNNLGALTHFLGLSKGKNYLEGHNQNYKDAYGTSPLAYLKLYS